MLADCPESRGVGLPEMCGGNQQVLTWAYTSLFLASGLTLALPLQSSLSS